MLYSSPKYITVKTPTNIKNAFNIMLTDINSIFSNAWNIELNIPVNAPRITEKVIKYTTVFTVSGYPNAYITKAISPKVKKLIELS